MMTGLQSLIHDQSIVGTAHSSGGKSYTVSKMDDFEYTDPIDGAVAKNQVRLILH